MDLITAGSYWLYDRTRDEHALIPRSGNSQERASLSVERPSSISPNLCLSIHLAHLPVLLECAYAGARMFVELASIANENGVNQPERMARKLFEELVAGEGFEPSTFGL